MGKGRKQATRRHASRRSTSDKPEPAAAGCPCWTHALLLAPWRVPGRPHRIVRLLRCWTCGDFCAGALCPGACACMCACIATACDDTRHRNRRPLSCPRWVAWKVSWSVGRWPAGGRTHITPSAPLPKLCSRRRTRRRSAGRAALGAACCGVVTVCCLLPFLRRRLGAPGAGSARGARHAGVCYGPCCPDGGAVCARARSQVLRRLCRNQQRWRTTSSWCVPRAVRLAR